MRSLFLFILILVAALSLFGNLGCGSIVPPAGGPKDSTPPRLLKVDPRDSTVNFRGRDIYLDFDEFIDLKDAATNLMFTPSFEPGRVKLTVLRRGLHVQFRDTLLPNTTYVMNFGNAIVDITEGNAAPNFTYIFSTGPVLDSLEVSGRVQLAETGGIDSTLSVMLYRNRSDSAVSKTRAPYIIRVNGKGEFRFRYLPADTFAIYALATTVSRNYDTINRSTLFAFADRPVVAGRADSIVLYAYRERPVSQPASSLLPVTLTRIPSSDRRLRINFPQGTQDIRNDYTFTFPVPLRSFDSSQLSLSVDSVFSPVPFTASLDTTKKSALIKADWKPNSIYNLVLQQNFATDTANRQLLKTDTIFFNTKKLSDYGNVSIRLRNIDSTANPVLQFVQNNVVVFSAPVGTGRFSAQLFTPGEYSLRILFDRNRNGKWDPGHFFGRKEQPEIVKQIDKTITVKADWDNTFEL